MKQIIVSNCHTCPYSKVHPSGKGLVCDNNRHDEFNYVCSDLGVRNDCPLPNVEQGWVPIIHSKDLPPQRCWATLRNGRVVELSRAVAMARRCDTVSNVIAFIPINRPEPYSLKK